MSVWSTSTPAGSDLLSQGDDKIREMKTAIQEALRAGEIAGDNIEGVEAIFPGASPSSAPVYRYRGLKGPTVDRPTAGQYGFYFDTTRNVLQRDNGVSWDDVGGTQIPSGTKMVFYQASAPSGWTAVALNDKFLRVVTSGGTGGTTGGSISPSSSDFSHTHTTGDVTLTINQIPSHNHRVAGGNSSGGLRSPSDGSCDSMGFTAGSDTSTYWDNVPNGEVSKFIENSGGGALHNHGTTSSTSIGVLAYADIIVCSKD